MDPEIIDKVLSRNASPEEARQAAAWFATEQGQAYLSSRYDRESYLLNEESIDEWTDGTIPTDKMKIRFLVQLKMRVRTFRVKLVAAVLIPFILLAGTFIFVADRSGVFSSGDMAEITVPYGEQMHVILPDGTVVHLNSGTGFQYPKTFGLFNRKVQLKGEAYFSVAKETNRPFIVNLDEIDVKVTGTKFNVKAYPEDNIISVALEEGGVDISDKQNNTYVLKPNQSAVYDKSTGICTVNEINDLTEYIAWSTRSLNFYRTPLKEILKTMQRQFEVIFNVNDSSLLEYRFSISTSRVNVDEILLDLEKVSKIRFKSTDDGSYDVFSIE